MKNYYLDNKKVLASSSSSSSSMCSSLNQTTQKSSCCSGSSPTYTGLAQKSSLAKNAGLPLKTCLQVAARIWCDKEFSDVVMDPKACEEIAKILQKVSEG